MITIPLKLQQLKQSTAIKVCNFFLEIDNLPLTRNTGLICLSEDKIIEVN